MATGIRDRVCILGMGCTRFGERWDCSVEDLIVEAFSEAADDAQIEVREIDQAWYATALEDQHIGKSGIPLSVALRLPNIAVGFCSASSAEALRSAAYAVAAGVCDIALALGCEKLKDTGFGGIPQRIRLGLPAMYWANVTPPSGFAQLAKAYESKYHIAPEILRRAMAHISVKSHNNGSTNPKAHLRNRITVEQVLEAQPVAPPLGLFDCCGVSDGAACAILTTPEIARARGKRDLVSLKALQLAVSNGEESQYSIWDGAHLPTTRLAAVRAYAEAEIRSPESELDMLEVHDCFSIAELVALEDLLICADGTATADILRGRFDADGDLPCQTDGGLKCFGHPISASGLRMVYELYSQLLGRAGERQIKRNVRLGLAQSLGGFPHQSTSAVVIVGRHAE